MVLMHYGLLRHKLRSSQWRCSVKTWVRNDDRQFFNCSL